MPQCQELLVEAAHAPLGCSPPRSKSPRSPKIRLAHRELSWLSWQATPGLFWCYVEWFRRFLLKCEKLHFYYSFAQNCIYLYFILLSNLNCFFLKKKKNEKAIGLSLSVISFQWVSANCRDGYLSHCSILSVVTKGSGVQNPHLAESMCKGHLDTNSLQFQNRTKMNEA